MGSCCAKPVARIIKVGNSEAGIIGLEDILKSAHTSGKTSDEDMKKELLALAKESGNYIAPGVEAAYKEALLREYREFCRKQA